MTINHVFIPTLTTPAGSCLTADNWREVGVTCVSYDLSFLLIKPGLSYLKILPDWQTYSGWNGEWLLNASMPSPDASGEYVLRSPFDGSRIRCNLRDIVDVILNLKPHQVILPSGFEVDEATWQQLRTTSMLYVPVEEQMRYADRLNHDHRVAVNHHVITNQPAADACNGMVYVQDGQLDLKDKAYAMDFDRIVAECQCPTCQQGLTRAYLHHLYEHTPLLCHRFLIQHNVFNVQ